MTEALGDSTLARAVLQRAKSLGELSVSQPVGTSSDQEEQRIEEELTGQLLDIHQRFGIESALQDLQRNVWRGGKISGPRIFIGRGVGRGGAILLDGISFEYPNAKVSPDFADDEIDPRIYDDVAAVYTDIASLNFAIALRPRFGVRQLRGTRDVRLSAVQPIFAGELPNLLMQNPVWLSYGDGQVEESMGLRRGNCFQVPLNDPTAAEQLHNFLVEDSTLRLVRGRLPVNQLQQLGEKNVEVVRQWRHDHPPASWGPD